MRIISLKGEFELPVGFEVEITSFNPIFNDQGEQSVPLTLPPTYRNMYLLDYPDRIDSYYKPVDSMLVDVLDGVFMQRGRMVVHQANYTDGISCTLYFREGSFYAKIEGKNMDDVPLEVIHGEGASLDAKRDYLIAMLKSEYKHQTSDKYGVFPVQTSQSVTRKFVYEKSNNDKVEKIEEFNLVLNGFETAKDYPFNNPVEKLVVLDTFMAEREQVYMNSSDIMYIGLGYGMTAFVDVFYFLGKMFAHFGYEFDDNTVRNSVNGVGGKLVMLNNVADAIYDGFLDLNQLVPDMDLKTFLKRLSDYFSGVFFIDDLNKRADFYMYRDLFDYVLWGDMTKYLSSRLRIEGVNFQTTDLSNPSDPNELERMNVNYIQTDFPPEQDYLMKTHSFRDNEIVEFEVTLKLVSVNNIVHKNSTEVKNSEIDEEKERDSSRELVLVGLRKNQPRVFVRGYYSSFPPYEFTVMDNWQYNCGYSAIYRYSEDDALVYLRGWYAEYFLWLKNSNIPVSCEMRLPPNVLNSLDLTKLYVIQGQLFFFDQIKRVLPYNGKQEVRLRTYRSYENR